MFTSKNILDAAVKYLQSQANHFSKLSTSEFVYLVEQTQIMLAKRFNLNSADIRQLDSARVDELLAQVRTNKGGRFIFRHGEQDTKIPSNIYSPADKKIFMMQEKQNKHDPITTASALEFVGTLCTMMYLQEQIGCEISVSSSYNQRAQEPALALSMLLGKELELSKAWNCVNYPDSMTSHSILQTLKNKDGNLTWNKAEVDEVVGAGTFDRMTKDMQIIENTKVAENSIHSCFTHTQQISILAKQDKRLDYYGFVYTDNNNRILIHTNGFYSNIKLNLENDIEPIVGPAVVMSKL